MEQEEEGASPMTPFWLRDNADHRRSKRRLRRSYSLMLTSTSLLVLLLVTFLTLVFIVVPTLHSFASHILNPHTFKNSWNSLNLLLVLFAIACAFLTKNTEPETPRRRRSFSNHPTAEEERYLKPKLTMSRYEYEDYKPLSRLRTFNSYPDLRQESPWFAADERRRFYDDTDLLCHRRLRQEEEDAKEERVIENEATITSEEVIASVPQQPPPSPPPSLPPPRTKAVRGNAKRTYQPEIIENTSSPSPPLSHPPPPPPPPPRTKAVPRNAKKTYQPEIIEKTPSPPPPHPPPPHQPATVERDTVVHGKKKRGNATREFLTSLRGKKKKQRHKSVENFETLLNPEPFSIASLSQTPSVFQNLFSSKKTKHKRSHSDSMAIHYNPISSRKTERSHISEENNVATSAGNESPLIPKPPPLPPFNLPAWKFRVQGDFVRVDSIGSTSGSSVVDEAVDSPIGGGEESAGSLLFCSTPDVDTKAHSFIERFRAGLRMEKMNSMKEKKEGIGRSTLGSSPNPQQPPTY